MFLSTHGIIRSINGVIAPFSDDYSFEYDGVSDLLQVGSTSLGITNAISISVWAKTTHSASNQYIIAEDPRGTNDRNWLLQFRANGEVQCVIWASNGSSLTSAITPLTYNNGNWIHILVTFDGTTNANGLKIYVNGSNVVQATASVSGIFSNSSSEPIIGGESASPTLPFNGNLDEPAVFDYALTSTEVSNIYGSGVPTDISSLSPVGWWREENATFSGGNWTITDSGSGGNDATSISMNSASRSTDVPT